MSAFYRRLFPVKQIYTWLNQDHGRLWGRFCERPKRLRRVMYVSKYQQGSGHIAKSLSRSQTTRILSVSLPDRLNHTVLNPLGPILQRYNSFSSHVDFHKEILRLNPSRFEIGAVYNLRPRDKRTQIKSALKPQQRELVFDIDMTDYDEIRTCCQGKGICMRCWKFISSAVKVLDRSLRGEHYASHACLRDG